MDAATIITTVVSSMGLSVSAAAWLSKQLVSHRLKKDLETFKGGIKLDLDHEKASWEGQIRKEVELYLADRAADREYQLEARKRLYSSIGPLKFQLLLACRDYANRIASHGLGTQYAMDLSRYYGKSTLYRLLKPFAISELIERQMTYFDFSVDPSAVSLLQFKRAAYAALTSGSVLVDGQPGIDWENQDQHVFYDNLSRAANALILEDGNLFRTVRFHEFDECLATDEHRQRLDPLPRLFTRFTIAKMPIWWIRLVALGNLCNEFDRLVGANVGLDKTDFPIRRLVAICPDAFVQANVAAYEAKSRQLAERAGLAAIPPIASSAAPAAAGAAAAVA